MRAVDGVDLDVTAGRTLAVMGPSGCGKSTLLHLPAGLDQPTAGELFFGDRHVEFLQGVGPDTPEDKMLAIAPDHSVFRIRS